MNINELYKMAVNGDRSAENTLFKILAERFQYLARHKIREKESREEIVQTVLAVIADKYRDMEIKVSFSAWVHSIFKNKIIDYYRSKVRESNRDVSNDLVSDYSRSDPELKMRLLHCLKIVRKANTRYARVLVLKYMGFNLREICERLNISIGNSYTLLSRARFMLDRCLKKGGVIK